MVGMIHVGDYVTVRTSVTGRTTVAKVLNINFKHGWFTGEVSALKGKYSEAFWIDDIKGIAKTEASKRRLGSLIDDDPDAWLSEWDAKDEEEAERFARGLSK